MLTGFNALAELYYTYGGEFFHLAVFEPGDDPADLAAAYRQTHERYLEAIGGPAAGRILDVACGGGALSAWLADRTNAQVLGVDLSDPPRSTSHGSAAPAPSRGPRLRSVRRRRRMRWRQRLALLHPRGPAQRTQVGG